MGRVRKFFDLWCTIKLVSVFPQTSPSIGSVLISQSVSVICEIYFVIPIQVMISLGNYLFHSSEILIIIIPLVCYVSNEETHSINPCH